MFWVAFVSGVNEIRKIFYTLTCIWIHMWNMVNLKISSFDCKIRPLHPLNHLQISFAFKTRYPDSHIRKERELEGKSQIPTTHPRIRLDHAAPFSSTHHSQVTLSPCRSMERLAASEAQIVIFSFCWLI